MYKAKSKLLKEWVEGELVLRDKKGYIVNAYGIETEIIPFTIMVWTGKEKEAKQND